MARGELSLGRCIEKWKAKCTKPHFQRSTEDWHQAAGVAGDKAAAWAC